MFIDVYTMSLQSNAKNSLYNYKASGKLQNYVYTELAIVYRVIDPSRNDSRTDQFS